MPSDIDYFWVFEPNFICIVCKLLYNSFKVLFASNIINIKSFDLLNNLSNKSYFFFAIFDDCLLFGLGVFLKNWNICHKWNMVQWHSPFRINSMIVELFQIWLEKYKVNDWIQLIWVVCISSRNLISSFRQTNILRVCDICKSITID